MTSLGTYDALGARFELRADGRLAKVLADSCADLRVGGLGDAAEPQHLIEVVRRGPRRWTVRCDGHATADGVKESEALRDALAAINGLARSAAMVSDTVLDAGAVEIDGVAVAFVGPGGARKSAFAAAAALSGCAYIADEVLAIDQAGRVRPFHRPIGLRHRGIESLGLGVPRGPYAYCYPLRVGDRGSLSEGAPLGVLVLVERDGTTSTVPLPEPLALVCLANQTLEATGHERVMFWRLDQLVRRVPVITMAYADLDASLATIRMVLEAVRN